MDRKLHEIVMNWSHFSNISGLEKMFAEWAYDLCTDKENYDICIPESIEIDDLEYIKIVSKSIESMKNNIVSELDDYLEALEDVRNMIKEEAKE